MAAVKDVDKQAVGVLAGTPADVKRAAPEKDGVKGKAGALTERDK